MLLNYSYLLDAADTAATAAEGEPTAAAGIASMLPTLLFLVVMIVVFYFMLIRPQKKKDKAVKDMLANLKVGDRICTIGGIYGTVTGLREDSVTLSVGAQKMPMVIARWGVRSVEDAPLENDTDALV